MPRLACLQFNTVKRYRQFVGHSATYHFMRHGFEVQQACAGLAMLELATAQYVHCKILSEI